MKLCKGGNALDLEGKKIGYGFTGSFCTFRKSIEEMKKIVNEKKAIVFPIMSFNGYTLDTKFGKAKDFIEEIESITGNKIIHSIQDAEPIGPKSMFDILIVAPCSRKYYIKACFRYYRWTCNYGS